MANTNHNKHEHSHHIVPLKHYWLTIFALLILTIVTVGASYINFGSSAYNWAVSMAIACTKASLVLMIFMGLKWDDNLNRISIACTVAALATFVWLAASDLWVRTEEKPVAIKKAAAAVSMDEVKKFEADASAARIAHGKELFLQTCATCHGAEGNGDGAAGAALNPKPRNFHAASAEWKNGTSKRSIYVTLAEGIKGSGMASYTSLSIEDRWALVHFIRSMNSNPQDSGKADAHYAEVLEKVDGVGPNAVAKESIPIDLAIDLMVGDKK